LFDIYRLIVLFPTIDCQAPLNVGWGRHSKLHCCIVLYTWPTWLNCRTTLLTQLSYGRLVIISAMLC